MTNAIAVDTKKSFPAVRADDRGKLPDWLLETGVTMLCELIEAASERFGFVGFGAVDVYNDPRAIIETSWDRKRNVYELELSDTLLRTVDEQQLLSLVVRAMAFAAIGCQETLTKLDDEAEQASRGPFSVVRAFKLRRVIGKQREMRHALEFLADLKTLELGLGDGLMRFLATHQRPLGKRFEYRLGWDIKVPNYEYRLERLQAAAEVRREMAESEAS